MVDSLKESAESQEGLTEEHGRVGEPFLKRKLILCACVSLNSGAGAFTH